MAMAFRVSEKADQPIGIKHNYYVAEIPTIFHEFFQLSPTDYASFANQDPQSRPGCSARAQAHFD